MALGRASGDGGRASGRASEAVGGRVGSCERMHFEPTGRPAATSSCAASGLAAPGWEAPRIRMDGSGWEELPQPTRDGRLLGCRHQQAPANAGALRAQ